jgi:hypothetical protein
MYVRLLVGKLGESSKILKVENKLKMLQAPVASGRGGRYITLGCILLKTS